MRRVVAIDLGASSGRVLVGSLTQGLLEVSEVARFSNGAVAVPRPGLEGPDQQVDLQWDTLSLWGQISEALVRIASEGPVEAVGIDTWAVDYGLLEGQGCLIGNPMCYRSDRTEEAVKQVESVLPSPALYSLNGLQYQPFNTIYQMVADRGREQAQIAQSLLVPDLLGFWLTGRRRCEVTNASTTGLIDPSTRNWSPTILDVLRSELGVEADSLLAPLVEPGTVIGPIACPGLDLRTEGGDPTPLVAVGSHDTASAVAAVPAREGEPGYTFGFVSSGTWSLAGVELREPVLSEDSRELNFTNELDVDKTVRYTKNITGLWVQQELLREWRIRPDWKVLDAKTNEAPALRTVVDINDDSFFAPGAMTPRINAAARATGQGEPRTEGEYLRTVTESLAIAYRRTLRQAETLSGKRIDVAHIVGGGSKNGLLCQSTPDATGLPVVAGPVEGTAIGNLTIQLRTIGALEGDLGAVRQLIDKSVETKGIRPRPRSVGRLG